MRRISFVVPILILALAAPLPAAAEAGAHAHQTASFTVLASGTPVGQLEVRRGAKSFEIDYEFRNNGRGPTLAERVELDAEGFPVAWRIEGHTTFGNPVDEWLAVDNGSARWQDTTGQTETRLASPALYVPQNASPYSLAIAARVLLASESRSVAALPGGELRLTELEQLSVTGNGHTREITAYALSGTSLNPTYFLMDGERFFGIISPRFSILAQGFEDEDERLRQRAADYGAERFAAMQARHARSFDGGLRIRDVRVFDPRTEDLSEPVSVVVRGHRIAAIEALDQPTAPGEAEIDGAGGTLLPGMFEMHGHLGETAAMLNILAGVTSVRDMGNNNEVLDALIAGIESGQVAGPRVYRSAFIEGRSPFNSNNGKLVSTQEEAVAAVVEYAERGGFHQIKIYNSMHPEWIPAVIAEARAHGLRVTGHIPAFTNADAMIAAGYDEIIHINQLMLGWVLEPDEDTRTLLRLTALQRLPGLDLASEPVQDSINAMVERGVSIDPTLAIHERLLLSRNGEVDPGAVDIIDHMPVAVQRSARSAMASIASPEEDAAYRGAFDQIIATLSKMRERGIVMVPGTDLGGGLSYHRELELYQKIGMQPAEILAWASLGMAGYLGVDDELGLIKPGYLADFFLVPGDPTVDLKAIKQVSMTVASGQVYFPAEVYPEFGIRPFVDPPVLHLPE
ncbi:MAG: amidohydrolase [Wenzhouxiangella sp.]|nr:MAG: amidohydrolase [Wenzhouxiangella sp.]